MKFSCYCHQNDDSMITLVFSFAKHNDIVYVEMTYLSYEDGNLMEDLCKFFVNEKQLQYIQKLNQFYQLSLHLSESNKLIYCDNDNTWRIRCRKHLVGKCFTDYYNEYYGFCEHPSVIFDKILKKKKPIFKYNKYSIKYYKDIYEKSFRYDNNYLDIYYKYEISKIEKELGLIEETVEKEIMINNIDIIREVLPDDIVYQIKSLLCV